MKNRRRSDVMINTYHVSYLRDMLPDLRQNVSPERHSVIISDENHDNEDLVRGELKDLGVDPTNFIFFYDPAIAKSVTEHATNVLKKLLDMGYEHGVHFDTDAKRIQHMMQNIPGTRCVVINR